MRIIDGNLQTPARLTIRELVEGCVDGTDAPTCTASKIGPDPITVRSKLELDGSRAASRTHGLGAVAVLGVMILVFAVAGH